MKRNVGSVDRIVRLILGALLVVAPFISSMAIFSSSAGTVVSVIVGVVLIATALMNFCPMYRVLGIRTCKI